MDKRSIEFFKAHQTRCAMRAAIRKARTAPLCVASAPRLTPNELDRFMQRRIFRE
jgi:hypothetical protein